MGAGTIRYWAAVREAAGVASEPYDADTLGAALAGVRDRHADRPQFDRVLRHCSLLVDGHPTGVRDVDEVELGEGAVVEVLPPFAGG